MTVYLQNQSPGSVMKMSIAKILGECTVIGRLFICHKN